jgi:hypothetical protein
MAQVMEAVALPGADDCNGCFQADAGLGDGGRRAGRDLDEDRRVKDP